MTLRAATLFSGIGCPEIAAPWIDWRFAAEVDPFASAVHATRFPHVPNLGDITAPDFIERAQAHAPIELVAFGSPCQSFSVAGKRRGLDDPRGDLALVALRVVAALRPRWICFENVPGLLSSAEGWDFSTFLGAVAECGYLGVWRVLDAQFAGVPQRRRRVFFVGHLGDWRPAAAVLFERESLRWNSPPRREAGQGVAPSLAARTRGGGGLGTDAECDGAVFAVAGLGSYAEGGGTLRANGGDCGNGSENLVVFGGNRTSGPLDVATAVNAHGGPHGRLDFESETFVACAAPTLTSNPYGDHESREGLLVTPALRADGFDASEDGAGRGTPIVPMAMNLRGRAEDARPEYPAIAFHARQDPDSADMTHPLDTDGFSIGIGVYPCLPANEGGTLTQIPPIRSGMSVRRLTPIECERLQGLPDRWTDMPYRGKPAADGPRYRAIGNGMAVPIVRWILERIGRYERAAPHSRRSEAAA